MQRFAGPRGFKTPDDMAARRQSGRISSRPYQSSAAIFVFTMPNDGAGTHPRSVFIRVTRTHTDQHITHLVAPLLPLITLSHHVSTAAPPALTNRQPNGAWRRAVITLRREDDDIARWELEPALTQAIQWLTRAPDRFSAAHFSRYSPGVSSEQAINMLGWCGVCGWLNRLKIALGETY